MLDLSTVEPASTFFVEGATYIGAVVAPGTDYLTKTTFMGQLGDLLAHQGALAVVPDLIPKLNDVFVAYDHGDIAGAQGLGQEVMREWYARFGPQATLPSRYPSQGSPAGRRPQSDE